MLNAEEFYENRMVFDATMINFVIIGEMSDRVSNELKAKHPEIAWHEIKGFRNLIAHEYLGIDAEEVWQIIHDDVLPLKTSIKGILKNITTRQNS